ncbi:hypothetical protein O3297_11845 [Janthinobacterium sp. SUN128]|uniref:hypothetical protein n=1 Tax=Janthinobacterium sp. SUN128 TaxID=3014790 RepID=UPI002712C20B|nr:hypothetical protein [Janthinobacterium sp. SUN128]MDO8034107.1 hypothetical protein [Janthinobacterium sp. SUN128]
MIKTSQETAGRSGRHAAFSSSGRYTGMLAAIVRRTRLPQFSKCHVVPLALASLLLGAAAPASAQVLWEDYRGIERVPANPLAPNYNNGFNAGSAGRLASLAALATNPPANAARMGTSPQLDWANGTAGNPAQLCNLDTQQTSAACRAWIMGRVMYTLVVFPQAGNYKFSVAHDDDVKVDFSTQYSTNYRNTVYNVPVGSVAEYSNNETDFQNLAGNFNSATPGGCYLARVLWNNVGGINYLHMRWTRPDNVTEIIPAAQLRDPSLASSYANCTNSKTDLAVGKVGPAQFSVGKPLSYTVKIWNRGPALSTGAAFNDILPASLSNVSWTCAASGSASCGTKTSGSGSNSVGITLGNLPVNAAVSDPTTGSYLTVTITATPGDAASIVNTANVIVSPNETDSDLSNNSSSTTATVRTNTLTVLKVLAPAGDSGLFIMNANGTAGAQGGNGATASAVVRVGNLATFAESAGTATILAQYQSSYSCARTDTAAIISSGAASAGNLTMPEAPVTCTISNRRLQADMQAVTTVPPGPYNAGSAITVTGVCTNNGPDNAAAPTCVMSGLPAGATPSCSAPVSPFIPGSRINCSSTFNLPASGSLTITTTAGSTTLDPIPANNVDSEPLGVVSPLVRVQKTVDKAAATVGDTVQWTLSAANTGTGATTAALTLADTLPANLASIVVTPTAPTTCAALAGNTLTCTVPSGLAPGASAQVIVSASPTAAGNFINSVLPSGGNGAGCVTPAACQTTTVVSKPLVDVTTTLNGFPGTSNAGDVIAGVVTYANLGPGAAEGVTYSLQLATGLAGVSVTGVSGTYDAGTGLITFTGLPATLAPGQSVSFNLSYTQPGSNISSVTSIIATTSTEVANDYPNTATVTVPGPNVRVTKTADKATANVGENIVWTITASNTGNVANQGVVSLADLLPPNLVVTSVVAAPGVTCPPLASWVASSTQTCTVAAGQLAALNGSRTVIITAHATAAGSLSNRIMPSGPDNPACSSASVCQTTSTITSPKVAVKKTVDHASVNIGASLSWSVVATNSGDGVSTAPITLTDTLPANLASLNVALVGSATCAVPAGNILTCTVPAGLAANGGIGGFTVTAQPTAAGTYANTVVPSGSDNPTCATAGDCATTSTVTSPSVAVTKSVDKTTVNLGDTITWTLKARNNGSGPTNAVITLTDSLPANVGALQILPVAPASCGVPVGTTLTCSVPAGLAANTEASIVVKAVANAPGTVANSLAPSGPDNPACATPGVCQTTTTVTSPNVSVKKTVDKATVNVGETITWTLTVSNSGTGASTGAVTLNDTLPAGLTNVVVSPQSPATCTPLAGATLACSVPAGLAAGASAKVFVSATATLAGAAVNGVVPGGPDNPACVQPGDCGTTTTVVKLLVDVTTTLNNFPPNTLAGDTISGTVTYANVGPGPAEGVTYTLQLTPGLANVTLTGAVGSYNPATGVVTLSGLPATLANGQSTSFNVGYTQPADNLSTVTSTIATTSVEVANDLPNTAMATVPGPIIRVTKLADKTTANVGETVTWTITATNTGSLGNLGVVTLTDILPANVTVLAVTPGAGVTCPPLASWLANSAQACTIAPGQLAAVNGSRSITISATGTAGGSLGNKVLPSGPDNPACAQAASCQTTTTILSPQVAVRKTVDKSSINVGDALTWTIAVANTGTGATRGVITLTDTLPANLTVWQVLPSAPATCAVPNGNQLVCAIPAGMAAGSTLNIIVKGLATAAGAFVNTVVPSGPDNPACLQPGDCSTTSTAVKLLVDVTTTLNGFPGSTHAGDTIAGTVTFSNIGPGAAEGVSYSLQLAPGLAGVTLNGVTGNYNAGSGLVTFTGVPATLALGQGFSFQLGYTQPASNLSTVVSRIATTSTEVANDQPNVATVTMPGSIIRVSKTANKAVANVNEEIIWTITASNTGSLANQGAVVLTDLLPPNIVITAVTPDSGVTCPPLASWVANSSQSCSVAIGQLAAGNGQRQIVLTGKASAGGSLANQLMPSGPDNPACFQASSCQTNTTITSPALALKKTVDKIALNIGDSLSWSITLANTGTGASTAVATVTDTLPAGLADIVVTPAAPVTCAPLAGNILTCSVPAGLAAGSAATLQVTARAVAAGSLANSVSVSGPDTPVCLQAGDCGTTSTVSSPLLTASKTVDKTVANVGDNLIWSLSLRNTGTGPSTAIATLSDTLPAGLANVLVTPVAPVTCAVPVGNVVTCSVPAGLAAGSAASVKLSATATASGSLVNALVPGGPDNPACAVPGDCQTTTVVSKLLVDVTTTLNGFPASSNAGDAIRGVVTFANTGPGVAENVTYSLQLETGLAAVSLSAISGAPGINGAYNSSTGLFVLSGLPATLIAGQSASFNLFYTQPASNSSRISSVVGTSSTEIVNDLPNTATTNLPGPVIRASKTVDKANAAVGDILTWTITAVNTGNLPNQNPVVVSDVLPANIVIVSVTPDAGVTCPPAASWTPGSVQACTVAAGQLAASNGSRKIVVTGRGSVGGNLSNRVVPSGGDNPACDTASACQATSTLVAPQVAVRKSVDKSSANVGDLLTWTITASNGGTGATKSAIVLTDNLPAGVSGVQVLSTQLATCAPVAGNIVTCSVTAGLAPGGQAQVVLRATVSAAGVLQNTVLPAGPDNPVCIQAADCTTSTTAIKLLVDVTTTLNGFPGTTNAGDQINGIVTFSNAGPGTAENVTYNLKLAQGLMGVTLSGAVGNYDAVSGMLTVQGLPSSLALNDVHSFGLSYIQPASNVSTIVSIIATSSTEVANDLPNTATVTMPGPVIRVTKSTSTVNANVGDSIVWTITAVNSGGVANAGIVTLADILPANISVLAVNADAGVTCPPLASWVANSVQSCRIAAGQLAAVNGARSVRVTATGTLEGNLSNRVMPSGPDNPACAQASSCESSVVLTGPKVAVKKIANRAAANVGETVVWTISATNSGSGPTRAAMILVDTLPAGLTNVVVTPLRATCAPVAGNVLTCSVPAGLIGNGGEASVEVSATVTQAGSARNSVVPSGPDAPLCLTPSDCQTSTNVTSPSVMVKKVADKANASIGDTVSWTITAANGGSGATTAAIVLTDDLATSLTDIAVTPAAPTVCAPLAANKLVCTVPAGLAPNAVAAVTVSAKVAASGSLSNTIVPTGTDLPRCAQASDCTAVTEVANPAIGAALGVGKVTQLSAKVFNVPYTVVVKNVGKGTASNVQALDSLRAAFPEPVACRIVTPPAAPAIGGSRQLAVNPGFTGGCGGSDLRLLSGDAALAEGELSVITFTVEITVQDSSAPQYNNSVFASALGGNIANGGGSISVPPAPAAGVIAANPGYTPPAGSLVFDASNNGGGHAGAVATAADVAALVEKVDPNRNGNASETVGGVPFTGEDTPTPVVLLRQVVDVIKAVSAQQQVDASKFEISYTVQAANRYPAGYPTSTMVQVAENLRAVFPTATSVTLKPGSLAVTARPASATACVANPDFNGATVFGLLNGKGDLQPQESCSIGFTVLVDFGSVAAIPTVPQLNQVYASTMFGTDGGGMNIGHSYSGTGTSTTPVAPASVLALASSADTLLLPATPGATPPSFTPVVFNTTDKPMLLISKSVNKTQAEIGDSLQYTIEVKNTGVATAFGVSVLDKLPAGFRYIDGTTTRNNVVQPDPSGKPGPQLSFKLESLAPNASASFRYRLRVGVGSLQGDGVNRAQATTTNGPPSNEARAKVKVTGGVFTTDACLAGKVFVDCNNNHVQDGEELGIPGVRLYMEDGTNFTTDVEGKYSYCGITPNSHVIKVDGATLPRLSRMMEASNRNLGDPHSLFLDTKNGELLRADFIEGSCSNPVLEQVKARRAQGEVRSVEREGRGPGLSFSSQPAAAPAQATDSANQPVVAPRLATPADGGSHAQ